MLMDGVFVPLLEPFYRDGRSYLRKLEASVGRYSLTPAAGMVALAPGGEAGGLSDAEIAESLKVVGEAAAREKVLIAGVEKDSVAGALAIAEGAYEAGFDAVLVAAPPSWQRMVRESGRGVVSLFFRAVADASVLPVLVWSAAEDDGCVLGVEEIGELAGHPNVVGLVDAGLDVERLKAVRAATAEKQRDVSVTTVFAAVTRRMLKAEAGDGPATFVSAESLGGGGAALAVAPAKPAVKTRTKTVGFQVVAAGDAVGLVGLLEAGVGGAMPRLAACAPQATYEVWAAFKDGDPGLAAEKAERLRASDDLLRELGVSGVKHAADLNGYFGGVPRLPRVALTAEGREQVERVMVGLRN
jgi:4-hydroxy-2-oxoglutarate aldolase